MSNDFSNTVDPWAFSRPDTAETQQDFDFSGAVDPFAEAVNPFGAESKTTTKDLLSRAKDDLAKHDDGGSTAGNMVRGALERGGQLLGGIFRAGDAASKSLDANMPMGGLVWEDGIIPKYYGPSEYRAKMQQDGFKEPLDIAAKAWQETDAGYEPDYTWEKVKHEFGENGPLAGSAWGTVMGYAAEQGIKSVPDMVAAVLNLPAYITTRSGEIGQTRAENKGKETAELSDVLEAVPFATASALLERIGAKGITDAGKETLGKELLQAGILNASKNIGKAGAKSGGREAATEFIQEGMLEYVGERFGTDAKMSFAEAFDQGLAGAVAGGVYGGAAGTTGATIREGANVRNAAQQRANEAGLNGLENETAGLNDWLQENKAAAEAQMQAAQDQQAAPRLDWDGVDYEVSAQGEAVRKGDLPPQPKQTATPKPEPELKPFVMPRKDPGFEGTQYEYVQTQNEAGEDVTAVLDKTTGEVRVLGKSKQEVSREFEQQIRQMVSDTLAQRNAGTVAETPEAEALAASPEEALPAQLPANETALSEGVAINAQEPETTPVAATSETNETAANPPAFPPTNPPTDSAANPPTEVDNKRYEDGTYVVRDFARRAYQAALKNGEILGKETEYDVVPRGQGFDYQRKGGIPFDVHVSATGRPFKSKKAAAASLKSRLVAGKLQGDESAFKVVAVGNGFGFRENKPEAYKPSSVEIENAAAATNTNPTEAQAEAGNYKKGRIKYAGLDIAIENPKGSVRRGTDKNGRAWESKMAHHYGDIKGTKGADGDPLDVFIGDSPESDKVFVVDQVDPATGKFDEHKVMVGFTSIEEAKSGYLANYESGWKGLGSISEASEAGFKKWMGEGDTRSPYNTGSIPDKVRGNILKQVAKSIDAINMDGAPNKAPYQKYLDNVVDAAQKKDPAFAAELQATIAAGLKTANPVQETPVKKPAEAGGPAGNIQPSKRPQTSRYNRDPDPNRDDLIAAIAQGGGIAREFAEGVDPADYSRRAGIRWVFPKNAGKSLDEMTEYLRQFNYVNSVEELQEKLDRALRGETVYAPEGYERLMEQVEAAESQMAEPVPEPTGLLVSSDEEWLSVAVNAAEQAGVPANTIQRILDSDDHALLVAAEIKNEIEKTLRKAELEAEAIQQGQRDGSGKNPEGARGEQLGDIPFNQPGNADPDQFFGSEELLSSYTEQDIQAREAEAQTRKELAAAAERKADADAERDAFLLTGSDRAADQAAARGQNDMFGVAPASPETKETSPTLDNATAPEHVAGVDDRELAQIVAEFNDAQASAISGENGISDVFKAPEKDEIVRLQDKVKVYHAEHGWMTPAEAKKRIEEWKVHAWEQGEGGVSRSENAEKVVLSLFDLSGKWSEPWEQAGYQVYRFDIQDNPEIGDVNKFSVEFFGDYFGDFQGADVYAVLAACPCTDFASSGARHFAAKDGDGRTVASVSLVHQTLRVIEYFKPSVWAVENPVGRIEKLGGLPPWRLSFDPNHIGEDYTKKTLLWGRFNADLPIAPTEATEGSKMHRLYGGKSMATKNARSETPEGFAYSFFMANNAYDHPVMAIHNKYDQMDRDVIQRAVDAGMSLTDIDYAVGDPYYMEQDYDAANEALLEAIQEKTGEADLNEKGPAPKPEAINAEKSLPEGVDSAVASRLDQKAIDARSRVDDLEAAYNRAAEAAKDIPGWQVTGRSNRAKSLDKKIQTATDKQQKIYNELVDAQKEAKQAESRAAAYRAGKVHENGQRRSDKQEDAASNLTYAEYIRQKVKPGDKLWFVQNPSAVVVKRLNNKTVTLESGSKWDYLDFVPLVDGKPMAMADIKAEMKDLSDPQPEGTFDDVLKAGFPADENLPGLKLYARRLVIQAAGAGRYKTDLRRAMENDKAAELVAAIRELERVDRESKGLIPARRNFGEVRSERQYSDSQIQGMASKIRHGEVDTTTQANRYMAQLPKYIDKARSMPELDAKQFEVDYLELLLQSDSVLSQQVDERPWLSSVRDDLATVKRELREHKEKHTADRRAVFERTLSSDATFAEDEFKSWTQANLASFKAIGGKKYDYLLPSQEQEFTEHTERASRAGIEDKAAVKDWTKATFLEYVEGIKTFVDGEMDFAEYRAITNAVADRQDQILAEINGLTKPKILSALGAWFSMQHKGDKKERLVDAAYDSMLAGFHIGRTMSFSFSEIREKGAYARRYIEAIKNTTEEQYATWQKGQIEAAEERKSRIATHKQAIADPQTLEEFRIFIRSRSESDLTPDQLARYDDLVTGEELARRKAALEKKAVVRAIEGGVGFETAETTHSKTGADLFVVKLVGERLDKDRFNELRGRAKQLGGYYSSFKGSGAIPGFQFKAEEDRQRFVNVLQGESENAADKVQARTEKKQDARLTRLQDLAERMETRANEKLGQDRKVNTSRRLGMAQNAIADAENELLFAKMLREIASGTESGEIQLLSEISTGTQLKELNSILNNQRYRAGKEYIQVGDMGRYLWKPETTTNEKVHKAEFPKPRIYVSTLKDAAEAMAQADGYKQAARSIQSRIKDMNRDHRVDLTGREWESLHTKIRQFASQPGGKWASFGKHSADTIKEQLLATGRLDSIGVTSLPLLRQALRELVIVKQRASHGVPTQTTLQKLEQKLQARILANRNAFNDFFPTPANLANEVAELAQIDEGHKVLEPSAGNGLLADAANELGAEVDAVEMAGDLREILQEKGYNLIGHDFMSVPADPVYDRVLMNPPFSNDQDIQHVSHAYKMLKPGGRLVAIVSSMAGDRQNKRNKAFREWLDELDAEEQSVAANAFTSSLNPTGVNTKILVIDKPDAGKAAIDPPSVGESEPTTKGRVLFSSDAPGLDMSFDARMERAVEQGYITDVESVIEAGNDGVRTVREKSQGIRGSDENLFGGRSDADHVYQGRGTAGGSASISGQAVFSRDFRGYGSTESDGKTPQFFYHGTGKEIKAFELGHPDQKDNGWLGQGIYLTNQPDAANEYARRKGGDQNVIPVVIQVKNLYRASLADKKRMMGATKKQARQFADILQSKGYDGAILQLGEHMTEVVVFDPANIRSVNAAFDPEKRDSNNLLFSDKRKQPPRPDGRVFYRSPANSGASAFQGAAKSKGMGRAAVERIVNRISKQWENKPSIRVVDRVEDLPADILAIVRARRPVNLQGLRDAQTGTVYLIAENITGTTHAERVLAHEAIGHWAMEQNLGAEFDQLLDEVQALKASGDKVILKYAAKVNGEGSARIEAAEIIAKMTEDAVVHPVLTKIMNWLRRLLKKLGFNVSFGTSDHIFPMIKEAMQFVQGEQQTVSDSDLQYSDLAFSQQPDEGVLFSSDTPEGAGYGAVKGITDAVRKTIVKAWRENWTADLRPGWLGLLTRRHLADIAGSALPQIKRYVRLAQEMDARRNELLSKYGSIAETWTKYNFKNREEAKRLAQLMHDATLAGVDPSKKYEPIITQEQVDEIRQKNRKLMKDRSRDGAGGRKSGIRSVAELKQEIEQAEMKLAQERNRAKAKKHLAVQWIALSPEARRIFRQVRDAYKHQREETLAAIQARIQRNVVDGKQARVLMDALREQFESVTVEEPYFPLARFGKYWVDARDSDGNRIFEMFETTRAQEDYMQAMQVKGYTVRHGASLGSMKQLDGVSEAFITDIDSLLEKELGTYSGLDGIKDEIYQMYLKTLPDLSARKHFIHRKKVEGFSKDALRAFADNTFHGSYQLARLEFSDLLQGQLIEMREGLETKPDEAGREIARHEKAQKFMGLSEESLRNLRGKLAQQINAKEEPNPETVENLAVIDLALKYQKDEGKQLRIYGKVKRALESHNEIGEDRVKASHLYYEMTKRHEWAMNPKGSAWANKLSSLGFVWYLGVSPAAALVNVTQTAMVAYPMLASKYGMKAAADALMRSGNDYFQGGFGVEKALTGDRRRAYNEAVRSGVIDKTLSHDLAGLSQEGATYNPVHNMVMEKVAFLFHNAERFNREVTYMAAYDLAIKEGMSHTQAVDYAHDLTWDSHFDYSAGNKARFMQNDFAKLALMFRQFALNMTYLLARNAYNSFKGESPAVKQMARRQLAGILGMHYLFAGAMGMPMFGVLGAVLEAVFDDEDEPWKFDTEFRNFLADLFGKDMGRILSHGIANETGLNIASRVSLDGLWLREPHKELEGRDQVAYWMEQLLGPLGGIAFGAGTAVDLWNEGHEMRALESTVPKFVKDPLRALRYGTQGAQTLRGDALVDSFDPLVLIGQAMGFSPAELSERYEANSAIKGYEGRIKDRRTNLINRFALANRLGDRSELERVKKEIIRFNAKNKPVAITRSTLIRSIRTRTRYSHDQIKGIVVDKKLRYLTENGRFAE